MNTKLNFLKSAVINAENDQAFMAYTLKRYRDYEKISESDVIGILNCSIYDYYKLALCKRPEVTEKDFSDQLKAICDYSGIDTEKLLPLIKRVNTLDAFTDAAKEKAAFLMAARDKEEGKNGKK